MTQDVRDDVTGPAFQADPYPAYDRWRRSGPVHRIVLAGGGEAWLVTRYEDARQVLNDPRMSKIPPGVRGAALPDDVGSAIFHHMLSADPPDHTRLRRLVSAAFTARRIEALRPRIQQISDDLLDDLRDGVPGATTVDLIDAYAFPLPIQVICELLGVPAADRDRFRAWSNVIVGGPAYAAQMPAAFGGLVAYIRALLEVRREEPGDDLLSGLIEVRDREDRLSENELSAMVFLLLIAGHETTVNLIGNGTMLLLADRSRWERVRADRALLPTAIEEFLRYEGPVATATARFTTEPVEIGGERLPAGATVLVGLSSANRDERRFESAGDLVLDREQNAHLAFGHGIHYCLGAPLARLEAEIAFTGLLDRFPGLRLAAPAEELSWRPGLLLRGLFTLPVTLGD
jgi:cytochrome P450